MRSPSAILFVVGIGLIIWAVTSKNSDGVSWVDNYVNKK